jgi:hypothetical protein
MMHRDRAISQVQERVLVLYACQVYVLLNQIPVFCDVAQEHSIALDDQCDAQIRRVRQGLLGLITQEDSFVIYYRFVIVFACQIQLGCLNEQAAHWLVKGSLPGGEDLIEDSKIHQEHERDVPKLWRVVPHSGHKEAEIFSKIHV